MTRDLAATARRGTYEVHISVEHYPRHNEDYAEKLSTADKLVDTGDPKQMVADTLRRFAAEIAPTNNETRSEEGIYAALSRIRYRLLLPDAYGESTRVILLALLESVLAELRMQTLEEMHNG